MDSLNGALLEFDFRNGPLRKKYDGLKYTLRRIQDLRYEQSLVGETREEPLGGHDEFLTSLKAISARMAAFDDEREGVIKKCRDVQKAAKQAIFAAHRGDLQKSKNLMETASKTAAAIIKDVSPRLRKTGSLSAAMEEIASVIEFFLIFWFSDFRIFWFSDFFQKN